MSAFDEKLNAGQGVVGTFCHLGGAIVAECLGLSGLDYVIIDTEHGPFSEESAGEMIRALQLHGAEPFVRVRDSSRAAVWVRGASSFPMCVRWRKCATWCAMPSTSPWANGASPFPAAPNTVVRRN